MHHHHHGLQYSYMYRINHDVMMMLKKHKERCSEDIVDRVVPRVRNSVRPRKLLTKKCYQVPDAPFVGHVSYDRDALLLLLLLL